MTDDIQLLKNRLHELDRRSSSRSIYCFSNFLNLHEQSVLQEEIKYGYTLHGGFEDAERKLACFGNSDDFGYEPEIPLSIIKVAPLSAEFSDKLTHRDFLGSVLGLGIKRELIGDIIITDNTGYIICIETISDFITDNLTKIRHTSVSCCKCDELPSDALPKPREAVVIVPSLRLDAVISAIYNLSRSKSSMLVSGEKVFINGRLTKSSSKVIEAGEIVSVRGYGRFRYKELAGSTRKDRLRIQCEIY